MIKDIFIINEKLAKSVPWTGDSKSYDIALSGLGPADYPFIVINPWASDSKPFYYIEDVPKTTRCVVWNYNKEWIAKYFPPSWSPKKKYKSIEIKLPRVRWERNPALTEHFSFDNTFKQYEPDPWEVKHELIWFLDPISHNHRDKIWAFRCRPLDHAPIDSIDMGYVKPDLPERLDVVFISYQEKNAEENWHRVLSIAPWAKRVHGVKGIFEAHKAAAYLSSTEFFYVVDGDAWLVDDWKFNHKINLFDKDCTYIWRSKNPFNDLTYGYGGVKLFSRPRLLKTRKWTTLDLSTTLSNNIKVMDEVSNITKFNTDKFSTWRSAFRECVKLCHQGNLEYVNSWVTNKQAKFSQFAEYGIIDAIAYFQEFKTKPRKQLQINDQGWLEKEYDVRYQLRKNSKSNSDN